MNGPRRLPPLLRDRLDVVFVGTEPGADSLRLGRYYANPGNSFYEDLATTGFTPTQLRPSEYRRLLDFGIGLDDVYNEPDELRARLEKAAPRAVCFNSKAALKRFCGRDHIPAEMWRADRASLYAALADITWAVDDSSGTARGYRSVRLDGLRRLRARLRGP